MVTLSADLRAGHDVDARVDRRAVADGHAVADGGERMDVDVAADRGGRADGGQRADADSRRRGRRAEMAHDGRKRPCTSSTWMAGSPSGTNPRGATTAAAAALLQQMGLLDLVDQRDLARLGIAHGGGAEDHQLAVANELPTDQRRKLGKGSLHGRDSFPGRASPSLPPAEGAESQEQWNVPQSGPPGKSS